MASDAAPLTPAAMRPEVEAVDQLRAAMSLLLGAERRRRGRQTRGDASLCHSHLRALSLLLREGEATAGALARATDLNPASVTAMVDQLERRGILVRRRHAADRRVCLVTLTAEGRAQVEAEEQAWNVRFHAVFADLPAEDLRAAGRVIERLTAVLDAGGCAG